MTRSLRTRADNRKRKLVGGDAFRTAVSMFGANRGAGSGVDARSRRD